MDDTPKVDSEKLKRFLGVYKYIYIPIQTNSVGNIDQGHNYGHCNHYNYALHMYWFLSSRSYNQLDMF